MNPGDLVRTVCDVYWYSTAERVNSRIPCGEVLKDTLGLVISPTDGTWVKWTVGGAVGWSNWTLLQVVT